MMNINKSEFWKPRRFLKESIPEIYHAAKILEKGVSAHNSGNKDLAEKAILSANLPIIREWYQSLTGKLSEEVHRYRQVNLPALKSEEKVGMRMPTSAIKKELIERDGYNCRYCGIPVIRSEIRNLIKIKYPKALSWGKKNSDRHSAFLGLWLTYEHVIPHSLGGDNSLENMIISCQACNCGKGKYSLEELGLQDPRNFEVTNSRWQGLENFKSI